MWYYIVAAVIVIAIVAYFVSKKWCGDKATTDNTQNPGQPTPTV